jgi:hypothetical protein
LDGQEAFAADLWQEIGAMGWVGAAIPEAYGGAGLGYEGLCILAEAMGRAVAPVPFGSCAYLAAEAILTAGTEAQRRAFLPGLADGSVIGCFALDEGNGSPDPAAIHARVVGGRLSGRKYPVADGSIAQIAVVAAVDEHRQPGLFIADLAGVRRRALKTLDPTRDHAALDFDDTPVQPLAGGWGSVQRVLDRAAILFAFEQIGGAEACLEAAKSYALDKLADMYVALELARSNAYYGAWALTEDAPDLPLAAATARVSATEAFHLASKEAIQTHGGIGFTWEVDCHLFYRRSKLLAVNIGSAPFWKGRLVDLLETRNAA